MNCVKITEFLTRFDTDRVNSSTDSNDHAVYLRPLVRRRRRSVSEPSCCRGNRDQSQRLLKQVAVTLVTAVGCCSSPLLQVDRPCCLDWCPAAPTTCHSDTLSNTNKTRRALGRVHLPPTKVFRRPYE